MRVIETFQITGRGVAAVVGENTIWPSGTELVVTVIPSNSDAFRAKAFKELVLRRDSDPMEREAFLLLGLSKADVPVGSEIRVEGASDKFRQ